MAPLLAEEIISHPAYDSVDWKLPPTTTGHVPVAANRRAGPFNMYYEIHGSGPTKLVWIMGLNASGRDWKRQTKHFGHANGHKYSCLVFDNRGVGRTDKPVAYYSTSEMARDVVDLLRHVGWIDKDITINNNLNDNDNDTDNTKNTDAAASRSIHVIGASMGGMIAQELALLIPTSVCSLTLCCTAPRLIRSGPFLENLSERARMFIPKHIDVELERMAHSLFADDFLAQPDTENADARLNFPTKRDRFAAGQLRKRADVDGFTKKGLMMQVVACYFHHKSGGQLRVLGDRVGRERIAVLHGTEDRMLTFRHGEALSEELGQGITWKVFRDTGHMIPWEREGEFNALVGELVERVAGFD